MTTIDTARQFQIDLASADFALLTGLATAAAKEDDLHHEMGVALDDMVEDPTKINLYHLAQARYEAAGSARLAMDNTLRAAGADSRNRAAYQLALRGETTAIAELFLA